MQVRTSLRRIAFALVFSAPFVGSSATLEAQVSGPGPEGRWPLQPASPGNRTLAPFMEGWYENEDGSFSISFGYLNANEDTLYIPVGADNFIEPIQFNGVQPTVFFPGHHRGLFTADLPQGMKDQDVVWSIRKSNGDVASVPGRVSSNAYQLDWNPRPHGSVHPRVTFDSQNSAGRGPPGVLAERTLTASVGTPITLSVNAMDPSERDKNDFRFAEALPIRAVWSQLQGPGPVAYTRHRSNPQVEEVGDDGGNNGPSRPPPGPEVVPLIAGEGTARVIATFSAPGDYLMRVRVDNFTAADSSDGDQCCWTNGYVRVHVTP
jgi:hypothetical protein